MALPVKKLPRMLLHSFIPVACSLIVGYLFYSYDIFNRQTPAFQFLWTAVVAAVFYNLLLHFPARAAYLGLFLLLLLTFVTTGSTRLPFLVRDVVYVAAIAISIEIYIRFFRKSASLNLAYTAFTLAGIYGVVSVIMYEFHRVILQGFNTAEGTGTVVGMATAGAFFGVMIGCAVGAGITLADSVFEKKSGR